MVKSQDVYFAIYPLPTVQDRQDQSRWQHKMQAGKPKGRRRLPRPDELAGDISNQASISVQLNPPTEIIRESSLPMVLK